MPSKGKKPGKKVVKKKVARRKPVARKKPTVKKRLVANKKPVAKKKPVIKKKAAKQANAIGIVTHYFPHVRAAVIKLKAPLSVGDTIKIRGHTTDFTQTISSMQIDRAPISQGKKGDEIGLLVNSRVRQHDVVTKA